MDTLYDKLAYEFGCAINAVFGEYADEDAEKITLEEQDIEAIANKVKFYLFG